MNYADIKYPDVQDGTGIRIAIYVSGCHFHCPECHNKMAWNRNYGKKFTDETIDYIINKFKENENYTDGLSLLGGEPLELYNQEGLYKLTKRFKEEFPDKDVWCWTGFDFDKDILTKMYIENEVTKKLLSNIDIIVDGQFVPEKKMIDLIARGSYNQKKIDVKASIKSGKTVLLKFGDEDRFESLNSKPKVIFVKEFSKENPNESRFVPTQNIVKTIVNNVDNEVKKENYYQKQNIEKISADGYNKNKFKEK